MRVTVQRFHERFGVPVEEIRRFHTYDQDTDTIQAPPGPIALSFACENLTTTLNHTLTSLTLAKQAADKLNHTIDKAAETTKRRKRPH